MKPIRQLLRQPIKTISGLILVALAVAILCLCVGQSLVALNFEAALDEMFTTIALPTDYYHITDGSFYAEPELPQEVSAWISVMTSENPDIIRAVASTGLASAYIPELRQDNFTNYPYNGHTATYRYRYMTALPTGAPYTCAVLEITLKEIGEQNEDGIKCIGVIESVIGLEAGFSDPTGFTLTMTMPSNVDLEIGARYLVFGFDYYDDDWFLRSEISNALENGEISIAAFDPDCIEYCTEEELEKNQAFNPNIYTVAYYHDQTNDIYFSLTNLTVSYFRGAALTVQDYTKLEDTVEIFLQTEDGALWQEYLNYVDLNAHCFPIIGIDKLTHIADFIRNITAVTTGREFTEEELTDGANVCIISESVAEESGLTVGDTIVLSYYAYGEESPCQDSLSEGYGVIHPGAYYVTDETSFAVAQEYTIVGLYQQQYAWYSIEDNFYAVSPNTIYVPKSSISVEMQCTDKGLFGALELYNGSMDEFYELLDEAGYSMLYECYDQGYTLIVENLQNYEQIAQRVLTVGIIVYGVVMGLYLLMFPARQKDVLHRMGTMGAPWKQKSDYILRSGIGVLLPGTLVGTTTAVFLWDRMVEILTAAVAVELELQLDYGILAGVAVGQFLLAMGLNWLVSLPMTVGRLMNRR